MDLGGIWAHRHSVMGTPIPLGTGSPWVSVAGHHRDGKRAPEMSALFQPSCALFASHRQRLRKMAEYDLTLPPGAEASLPLTGGNLCGTPSLLRKMWMKHKKKSEYLGATNSAFEADWQVLASLRKTKVPLARTRCSRIDKGTDTAQLPQENDILFITWCHCLRKVGERLTKVKMVSVMQRASLSLLQYTRTPSIPLDVRLDSMMLTLLLTYCTRPVWISSDSQQEKPAKMFVCSCKVTVLFLLLSAIECQGFARCVPLLALFLFSYPFFWERRQKLHLTTCLVKWPMLHIFFSSVLMFQDRSKRCKKI